jgi:CSLREA domain-containing protein
MSKILLLLKLWISIVLVAMLIALLLLVTGNPGVTYANSLTVNTIDDEDNNDGDCSLREAIKAASFALVVDGCGTGSAGPDTINFNLPPVATIVLTSELVIKGYPLTINGPGVNSLTLSGNNSVRVLNVDSEVPVTITNLTLENGKATVNGGALLSKGTLTLLNTVFNNNRAGANGGAIDASRSIVVSDSQFTGNRAPGNGGAMNVHNGGGATISASRFENNYSGNWGGALYADGALALTTTQLIGNSAVQWGGAVVVLGTTTVSNATFERNSSSNRYGAMLIFDNALIAGTTFISNSAVIHTGALRVTGDAAVSDSAFKQNSAQTEQAGALVVNGALGLTRTLFIGNQSATYGGGLVHSGDGFSVVNSLLPATVPPAVAGPCT